MSYYRSLYSSYKNQNKTKFPATFWALAPHHRHPASSATDFVASGSTSAFAVSAALAAAANPPESLDSSASAAAAAAAVAFAAAAKAAVWRRGRRGSA